MYRTLAVSGYRSLRDVAVTLGRVTVVTGANGTGKSSLYRALRLLAVFPALLYCALWMAPVGIIRSYLRQ